VSSRIILGGRVWFDENKDDIFTNDESLPGVRVVLYDDKGRFLSDTETDEKGDYVFDELSPGDYRIVADTSTNLPEDVIAYSESDGKPDSVIDFFSQTSDNTEADFGYRSRTVSVGDYVWNDSNRNGLQDAGEAGIPNVTVQLLDPTTTDVDNVEMPVLDSVTTDAEGFYEIAGLEPGRYLVKFVAPTGYQLTSQNQGQNPGVDSNADTTGLTGMLMLGAGGRDISADAGMIRSATPFASLGGYVWNDTDEDGIQNSDESGLRNIVVKLLIVATNEEISTSTNASGAYQFGGLDPGDYIVSFEAPQGYELTSMGPDGQTGIISLAAGEANMTVSAGMYSAEESGTIKGRVWKDIDRDGVHDPDEEATPGITVNLIDGVTGAVISKVTTDESGNYTFTGLGPGEYVVEFVPPAGYLSPDTETVTLDPGEEKSVGGGLIPQTGDGGVIKGRIWRDTDRDGIQDPDENIIPGVRVNLIDGTSGTVVSTVTTDAFGDYAFTGLTPGDYVLEFVPPAGYQPVSSETVTLPPGEERSVTVGFIPQTASLGAISGRVWEDTDRDGIQDADEPGLPGVKVNLKDPVTDSVLDTVTADPSGNYLFDGLVPGDYVIEFEPYPDGEFTTVNPTGTITLSPGETAASANAGIFREKSPRIKAYMTVSDTTGGVAVPGDILKYTVTFENTGNGTGTGIVFDDQPGEGLFLIPGTVYTSAGTVITGSSPSDTGVSIEVGDLAPGEKATVTFQVRVAEDIPPGTVLSDQGKVTADGCPDEVTDDPSTRETGDSTKIWVASEQPHIYDPPAVYKTVSGDRPVLYWEMVWINNSAPDAMKVHVEDDIPAGLTYIEGSLDADYGTYAYDSATRKVIWEGSITGNGGQVKIWYHTSVPDDISEAENQACGVWDRNGDGEWTDESASGLKVCSDDPNTPSLGDPTLWQGTPCSLSLGNFVWEDADKDGIYQPDTEDGLDGVKVNLYRDSNSSGDFTPDSDEFVDTVTTFSVDGEPGYYRFDNLCRGDYIVQVAPENFDSVLNGYSTSPSLTGPENDTDNDDNGFDMTGYGVVTAAIRLSAGDESVSDGDADPNTNMTVDFGFQPAGGICPVCPYTLTLGDMVWNDADNDGIREPESESGIDGVRINLYRDSDASGDYTPDEDEMVGTAVTFTLNGEPGHYIFRGLNEGDYIVQADASNFEGCGYLNGYVSSPNGPDPDDINDPDNDINNDDNGYPTDMHGVVTVAVTLSVGDEPGDDGDADPNTNMTADFGFHQAEIIPNPCNTGSLGGVIWNDVNRDKIRTSDETGIDDVRISLYIDSDGSGDLDKDADEFLSSAVTFTADGEPGHYTFENLPEGDYIVRVAPHNFDDYDVLEGYNGTTADIVPGQGAATGVIRVKAGVDADKVDLGFCKAGITPPAGRLTGYVWDDANGDGICQHETETAFDGVSVKLYRDSDGSGDLTEADELVGTVITFTDENGKAGAYVFENLDDVSAYLVQIPPENFDEGGVLAGYSSTGFTPEYGVVSSAFTSGGEMAITMDLQKKDEDGQKSGGGGGGSCFIDAASAGGISFGNMLPKILLLIGLAGVFLRRTGPGGV
jgi:uncharacterized repeat protein (TIGR01451 family)